jgi:orotidine-5'-phosphate decarboxylase
MTFNEKLDHIILSKNSLLCVGLDAVVEKLPENIRKNPEPLFQFNKAIIDATLPYAVAFKVNTAFYEAYGLEGWRALEKTFAYLPADVIKIADAKRGDIANTAQMYARALFESLGADAITANPLMGTDSVMPFFQDPQKGVFFLCLTSNQGSQDFQHFSDGQLKLYQRIAKKVNDWNSHANCGLVVGATHAKELQELRALTPELPFLVPGIGAQGGDLENSVRFGVTSRGAGAIFNSSRSIIFASTDRNFSRAAAVAAQETRDALNKARPS